MSNRREFLKEMGFVVGAGMLATAPWLSAFSQKNETNGSKCRIAIIGPGSRGRLLMGFLVQNPKVEIVAICDNYMPNLKLGMAMAPKAKGYTDYRKLLEDKTIDGVVIAVPPTYHARITIAAFAAGKNVYCEKALSIHMEEVLDMYNAYQASGKIFFVGQQRVPLGDPKIVARTRSPWSMGK